MHSRVRGKKENLLDKGNKRKLTFQEEEVFRTNQLKNVEGGQKDLLVKKFFSIYNY